MILSSTVRKLAAARATIYRVDVPAHKVSMPTPDGSTRIHDVPAYREWFATRAAAEKGAEAFRGFGLFGVPEATITPEVCTMETHYWNT